MNWMGLVFFCVLERPQELRGQWSYLSSAEQEGSSPHPALWPGPERYCSCLLLVCLRWKVSGAEPTHLFIWSEPTVAHSKSNTIKDKTNEAKQRASFVFSRILGQRPNGGCPNVIKEKIYLLFMEFELPVNLISLKKWNQLKGQLIFSAAHAQLVGLLLLEMSWAILW